MSGLRLALVSRRFWPQVGGAETATADLACEFRRLGHAVQIVTAQWDPDWPTEVVHREVPVYRLPHPGSGLWGTVRYMVALMKWLDRHRNHLDGVIVSMLRYDAWCAVRALQGSDVPVLLRAEGAGESGDAAWQKSAWWGGRIARTCAEADAVIVPHAAPAAELAAAGFSPARMHFIPGGVRPRPPRDAARRQNARNALREANPDLTIDDRAPLVVYIGRLHEEKGLKELVRAWAIVAAGRPLARLWLIGDGPLRDTLWDQISDLDLKYRICMPGSFDDVDDLLAAADLFVQPSHAEGVATALLEAMSAGLPAVVSDLPVHRELLEEAGIYTPAGSVQALAAAISAALDDGADRDLRGRAARARAAERHAPAMIAARYVEVVRELKATKAGGPSTDAAPRPMMREL